jgi:hypothetical protein
MLKCAFAFVSHSYPVLPGSILSRFNTAPKKYANSSLRQPEKSTGKNAVKNPKPIDPFEDGGLNEEDADATHPSFEPSPFVFVPQDCEHVGECHGCDPRCQNNVCDTITCSIFVHNLEVAVVGEDHWWWQWLWSWHTSRRRWFADSHIWSWYSLILIGGEKDKESDKGAKVSPPRGLVLQALS